MASHRVSQGECLSSIADRYGFFWQTLWEHPDNASLHEGGRHPNMLRPGDVVFIPEKRVTKHVRPTGARHRFQKRGVPARLRVELMRGGEPRANEAFTLEIDGVFALQGVTGPNGAVEAPISPTARHAQIVVGEGVNETVYEIVLGSLDPMESLFGVQARLMNLGFDCSMSGSLDESTRGALRAFQSVHRLPVTGEADDATQDKLRSLHDG